MNYLTTVLLKINETEQLSREEEPTNMVSFQIPPFPSQESATKSTKKQKMTQKTAL